MQMQRVSYMDFYNFLDIIFLHCDLIHIQSKHSQIIVIFFVKLNHIFEIYSHLCFFLSFIYNEQVEGEMEETHDSQRHILFGDESIFTINGVVSSQNCRLQLDEMLSITKTNVTKKQMFDAAY